MPFVNLGLVPEAGSSLLAPERFGRARAAEYLLLAEPFDAETAHALGLVNAVLPESTLLAHAIGKAAALAAKPRSALLATRRLMRGDPAVLKERMHREIEAFGAALASEEARSAFTAFISGAEELGRPRLSARQPPYRLATKAASRAISVRYRAMTSFAAGVHVR